MRLAALLLILSPALASATLYITPPSGGGSGSSVWVEDGSGNIVYTSTNTTGQTVTIGVSGTVNPNAVMFAITNSNGTVFSVDAEGDAVTAARYQASYYADLSGASSLRFESDNYGYVWFRGSYYLQFLDYASPKRLELNGQSADIDVRIEGDNDANLVYTDASTDRAGIGTSTPGYKLDVNGTFRATGAAQYDGTVNFGDDITGSGNASFTGTVSSASDYMCELSLIEDETFVTAGAAAFTPINDFEDNIVDTGYTTSTTGIVVSTAGRYRISHSASFSTALGSELECHLYTNGVMAVDNGGNAIGWTRTQGASSSSGVVAAHKTIDLAAGTAVAWHIRSISASRTITWHHGTFAIEKR